MVSSRHRVRFGLRKPEVATPLVAELGVEAETTRSAIAFGECVLFAGPFGAWPDMALQYSSLMAGKVVIDAANVIPGRSAAITASMKGIKCRPAYMWQSFCRPILSPRRSTQSTGLTHMTRLTAAQYGSQCRLRLMILMQRRLWNSWQAMRASIQLGLARCDAVALGPGEFNRRKDDYRNGNRSEAGDTTFTRTGSSSHRLS
jgi:hypothetical protein